MRIARIRKRDGSVVPFDRDRISDAIFRAAQAVGGEDRFLAEELAGVVVLQLERRGEPVPSIEEVQDAVERVLVETGHARTAKAYILYRERRAARRREREVSAPPLVGGDAGRGAAAWSKSRLAQALEAREGLPPEEAREVARRVEERVLASSVPRVSRSTLAALVRSELFDRGRESSFGLPARVGVPRARMRRWLDRGPRDVRAEDPAAFAETLGEELLRRHALDDLLPRRVAEAHRRGDLHVYDLGAPLRLTSVSLPGAALLERELGLRAASRAEGARRATGAVAALLDRHAPYAARTLCLEAVNALLAPAWAPCDDDRLAEEARELLLSPALRRFPGRGGALALELGVVLVVPAPLAVREAPPPAPPGRRYGDYGDDALRAARALLREAADLRRAGLLGGVRLTLTLRRGERRDAAARALVREALRQAAETGEPAFVFEDPASPARGSRWLRAVEGEVADPLRFHPGDLSVAGATGLNVVAAVRRTRDRGREALIQDLSHFVALAAEGAAAVRGAMRRRGEDPDGSLYALQAGPVPRVDLDGAFHLLEPVGLARASVLALPAGDEGDRARWRAATAARLRELALGEGRGRGVPFAVGAPPTAEAAARLARLDAARFPEAGAGNRASPEPGAAPSYAAAPPAPGALRREPLRPDPGLPGGWRERLRARVDAERPPPLDVLGEALACAEADPAIEELLLDPWPRRILRPQ